MAAGLFLYSLYSLLLVIDFMINTREFIVIQQIKTAFDTNGIILTIIHWKISINLLINFQKTFTMYICIFFNSVSPKFSIRSGEGNIKKREIISKRVF